MTEIMTKIKTWNVTKMMTKLWQKSWPKSWPKPWQNMTQLMARKTFHFNTSYGFFLVFVKAIKWFPSILSNMLSSILVKHLVVKGVSLPLPPSLSLAFSSSLSFLCPRLQYCLAPSPRPHSLRWPKIRHKTFRKYMAKNTTEICSKKYKHMINYEEDITKDYRHTVTIGTKHMTNRSTRTDKIKNY